MRRGLRPHLVVNRSGESEKRFRVVETARFAPLLQTTTGLLTEFLVENASRWVKIIGIDPAYHYNSCVVAIMDGTQARAGKRRGGPHYAFAYALLIPVMVNSGLISRLNVRQ